MVKNEFCALLPKQPKTIFVFYQKAPKFCRRDINEIFCRHNIFLKAAGHDLYYKINKCVLKK